MADVKKYTDQIAKAQKGRDVRDAIVKAINEVSDENNSYNQAKEDILAAQSDVSQMQENVSQMVNTLGDAEKTIEQAGQKQIQAIADSLDSTLTAEGKAADAKIVGENFNKVNEMAASLKEDIGDIWADKTVNIESDAKTYFFKFDVKSGETFIIQNNTNGWANISTKEQPLTSAPDVQLLANMKPNSTTEVVISDSAPYIRFYSSKAGMIYLKKKNTIVERIQTDIDKLKEQKTFICAKDGSGDFTKIVDAVNYINDNSVIDATLYICDGIWDICSEYGTEMETMNSKKRGLYLKNRIHIICSSRAVITAKYTGTNDTVREWFSAFNAGENGFILENAKIETDNIRYCVHDERDADSDSYKNQYINCDMTHTNGFYVQCIGGGLGLDGHIIIDGCKFKGKVFNSQDTPLVSYHNSADGAWDNTESKGAKSFIDIKGCYLADKGTFSFINFGKSNKLTTVLLHDNSIGGSIQISNGSKFYQQNIEILEWWNVNRNANINNITEEITIPGWYKIGYYSGEKHNTTNGVSLFFEIPKHVKQIRVVANGRAYFNDYTFINEDDNIVSYGTKLTQDKNINVLIDVPDGATKVVVGGKLEDCDSASVSYKATIKRETEAYIKRLVGKKSKTFFTVGVKSEGSVDNSIYYDVANAISITVNGTFEQRKDIATFIDNNGVLVGSVSATVTGSTEKTISVPKKAKTVYVSTTYQNLNSAVVFGKYEIDQSNLKGKKIVWLGTSIPAGGENGIEVADSYPVYIGKMLDATVYNEAVGSSCLHCKNKNRISERNPYGFVENFEGVSRCLTNTLNEMEWIIAHYNDTDVFTKNVPSTLSDKDKEFIRSCSYEKKINKYLTENNFPDLWIIDHGHNDTISDAQELQYEPMKMPWEAKTGFYQKGVLKTSAGKHLIEIDVDGFDMVYLSGVFNVGYDIYDIIDADGKVKKFEYANITKTVENLEIDCRGASRVAFSTETDKLETVIIKAKSTENLYCYQGAFDFIVKKIKEFNQKAEIYMIGEYENQLRPAISNYQIKTSERWSFPLFKAWNMYGWSQKKIKCTGYWSDGIWVEDGIERETTFLNRWLPDTIHPHSDKSGEALWYMAKYISAWLKNLIN